MTHRTRLRAMQVSTAIGLLLAAALLLWPADTSVTAAPPPLAFSTAEPPKAAVGVQAVTDSIIATNLFSLSRQAPVSRTFVAAPSDAAPPPDTYVADSATNLNGALGDSLEPESTERVPRLYGVVDGPLGTAALLRLTRASRAARLFRVGDGAGGYTVQRILADRVMLSGPSGSVVLRLSQQRKEP
jgi:hypothetical protein